MRAGGVAAGNGRYSRLLISVALAFAVGCGAAQDASPSSRELTD